MTAYTDLEAIFRRYYALKGAGSILHWDNATMMPSGAGDVRGEQLAAIAEATHEMITHPRLADLFDMADTEKASLDEWKQANLREMKRLWKHETSVPARLVSELTKACHESELFWRKARKDNNFAEFVPYQEKVLKLVRESAQAKADAMKLTPYDALLDQYEPGAKSAEIDKIFDNLASFLPGFITKVMDRQSKEPTPPIEISGFFPANKQKALGRKFMERLGFDFTRGRLDESTHPFCGGVAGDVRLTTRYNETDFLSGFFGIMHETGHALYEMGLPAQWRNQPVGEARGMAFHESQSLLVEMQLAISKDFLIFAAPLMREAFDVSGPAWDAENIYRLVTRVKPSLIRVDADEATYPAHVIIRYMLEKEMISGKLAVKDLPEAWGTAMHALLRIKPDTDANGCMQDIHWPDGAFGYFPTYTLGAMTAAQLFAAAKKANPDMGEQIRIGNFVHLFEWLKKKVHSQGSKLSSAELLKQATGQTLDVAIYKSHLEKRYLV
jgi:carboxypeptidase Taq